MSIRWDAQRKRWRFEFECTHAGVRKRATRLLPKGWSKAQADTFDRAEGQRLFAVATGQVEDDPLIDAAVVLYLQDKTELKSYDQAVEHLAAIAWAIEGRRMSELPAVAQDISKKRQVEATKRRPAHVLSAATVRNRLALLKAACRWAWKAHGLTKHDPTTRMQLPAVSNERHAYATHEQMQAIAEACTHPEARAAILLAFYTGMRLGELRRVRPVDGALVLDDTKNGDRRALPAHPAIVHLLPLLPLQAPRITIQKAWERARKVAQLEHLHFHDLRHSAASEMVNAGVDLFTVGKILGHRDPRSTQRYSHLRHETLADAIGKIGRLRQEIPHTPGADGEEKAA